MQRTLQILIVGAITSSCGEEAELPLPELPELPEVLASSKYIDYSTWEDGTVVCMDDRLAEWDAFIEEASGFLGVAPPTRRIQYVWMNLPAFPTMDSKSASEWDLWGCDESSMGCYSHRPESERAVIYSKTVEQYHELMHAVDLAAFGFGAPVLQEGVADYLGGWGSSEDILEDFPQRFKEWVDAELLPEDYRPAMQFVGSVLERYGVEKFKELRVKMPREARFSEFAAVFEEVYGRPLEPELVAMSAAPVQGMGALWEGCGDRSEVVPWAGPGLIDTVLRGECGDASFFGGGFAEGQPGFMKIFTVEVADAGFYDLSISGSGPAAPYHVTIDGCPGVGGTVSASEGDSGFGMLSAGRYRVRVLFPQAPEPRGEVSLRLERIVYPEG